MLEPAHAEVDGRKFTGFRYWRGRAEDDGKLYFKAFDAVDPNEVTVDSGLNSSQSIRARVLAGSTRGQFTDRPPTERGER